MSTRQAANLCPIRLGVCVDDFGLHDGVNEAGLALAAAGRVSALSCLVDAPGWQHGARALRHGLVGRVDLGLHLNLTESFGPRQNRRSLAAVVLRAYGGRLARIDVRDAVRAQLDAFEAALGIAPDFIDGHQHVHQLPVIRDAVLDELTRRYSCPRPWIRNTKPARAAPRGCAKSRIVAALGASRMQSIAALGGFPQNRHLLGVYDFGDSRSYASRLEQWIGDTGDNDLLMCHPSAFGDGNDPIATARMVEYKVLEGERFAQVLNARGIVVTRLSRSLVSAARS